jgi:signal transduction histidine kinase
MTIVIIVVFGVPLRGFVERVEKDRQLATLERDAFILAGHARETLNTANTENLPSVQPFLDDHSTRSGARVIITNSRGMVVASNDDNLLVGSSFVNRPEVRQALTGLPTVGERTSSTLGEDLIFVAVPVLDGDQILGVVRFSNPESVIDGRVRDSLVGIALAGLLTVLAGIALAIPVALGLSRPIRRLTRHTDKLARGEFGEDASTHDGPKEVRDLALAFNSMSRQLENMMQNQRDFNGVVSHQLRTPLTALRLRLEFLQISLQNTSLETDEALLASQYEVDRLQEIIEQLLKLSRLEAGLLPRVDVNVCEVLRSRVEMWGPLAEEKGVSLELECPSLLKCQMIEGGLHQVVDNFIDNALGVSGTGSTVLIRARVAERGTFIEVIDEGPGLTEGQKQEAFHRFWRAPDQQNRPGTGLGLAIVRQIASASGAEVYLADREDGELGLVAALVCPLR